MDELGEEPMPAPINLGFDGKRFLTSPITSGTLFIQLFDDLTIYVYYWTSAHRSAPLLDL